jgi:Tfp pilus assembly protein PilX
MIVHRDNERAFTLVITLIMVVLAAILVVGLLVTATADRSTAAAYDQRFQAELAAQSGLEAAKKALTYDGSGNAITKDDTFGVVRAPDPASIPTTPTNEDTVPHYYFVAHYQTGNQVSYYPLFSGGQAQTNQPVTTVPSVAWSGTQAAATDGSGVDFPLLFSTTPHSAWQKTSSSSPIHTSWVTLPSTPPTNQPYYRYAFWTEDLAGYVDANVAGNLDDKTVNPSGVHGRSLGYDPKEVALFTLFNSALSYDDGSTYAKTLVGDHGLLFTRMTSRLGTTANSSDDKACTASLVASLQTDQEQTIIPLGMVYKNEGQPKTNINSVIKNTPNDTGVAQMAKTISDNLPSFASKRQGSLTDDYNKTIAANIVGYASAANTPLIGTGYRGITLMPFVTEVYEMYYWKRDYYQQSSGGNYFVDIEVKTYAQLWNMFNQDITSGTLTFTDGLTAGLKFGTTGPTSSFDKGTKSSPNAVTLPFAPCSSSTPNACLKSNEYRSVLVSDITYTVDTTTSTKPTGKIYISDHSTPTNLNTDQDSSYTVLWNGVPYDRPGLKSGSHLAIERDVSSLAAAGGVDITGTVPALRYTKTSGNAPYLLGDPRMSYYLNATQYSNAYAGASSWGGEVYMKSLVETKGWIAGESRVEGWSDGGHNSTRGTTPATNPTLLSQDPTTVNPNPTIDSTKAPARSSNRSDGRIFSVTELGYIYDPFQWDPFASTPTTTSAVDSGWQNTWNNKFKNFPTAKSGDDDTYGSHSTLRIGRPEHNSFDQPGTRAWQLLDIFSAGDPADSSSGGAITSQISTRGKININTANREALRALGVGIKLVNDQAIQPAAVYGPQNSIAADTFADAVINWRQTQPFISASQLAQITATDKSGTANQPFFGNPNQWPANGPATQSDGGIWNDGAAEEYFAKIYNFTTVRSRNFRVFVTGQYVDPSVNDPSTGKPPRVIATANKVYQVFLNPTRDSTSIPTGKITGQTCQVTYQADVP